MRDRLVDLIKQANEKCRSTKNCDDCSACDTGDEPDDCPKYNIADHLIANGVIVPPCKVGDTVWFNTYKKNATVCVGVQPHRVDRIDVSCVCDTENLVETNLPSWTFGKTVFLTREEAERALKGGEG